MSGRTHAKIPGPFALLSATSVFRAPDEAPSADGLFDARSKREEAARRRLVEAQAAFDRARTHARDAPPEEHAAASVALEQAKAALRTAGRELRESRGATT